MKINEFKDKLASVTPEVPEHFHSRVEMTLENIVSQEVQMKESTKQAIRTAGRFSRRTLVIALAIVLALGAIALAATQWHIFGTISYLTGEAPIKADDFMQRDVYQETRNNTVINIDEVGYDGRILLLQYSYHFLDVDKPFGVTLRDMYGDNIPADQLEEEGGDPDKPVYGWGEEEIYKALTDHHVGRNSDSIWINGTEVNAPECSEEWIQGTKNPGEVICGLVWRVNNNGVIFDSPLEISFPIGGEPFTFTYDVSDIQSHVKTYHPERETVLPEGTVKVSETAFSPLMIYITVDTKADPEALAKYMTESDDFQYGGSSFESWLYSLQLVDSEGKLIETGGIGLETFNQESAKFLYSYQENLPDELWLAPVYNEDEPADMSEAVLVRAAQ